MVPTLWPVTLAHGEFIRVQHHSMPCQPSVVDFGGLERWWPELVGFRSLREVIAAA